MKPALSQVSSLSSPFEKDIEDYAASGCKAIELWLTKLETYLQQKSPSSLRALGDQFGVEFPVASYQGGILSSQGEQRRLAWELFDNRLRMCAELSIGTLILACDVAPPLAHQDLERVQLSLTQAAAAAAKAGVRIALEFQAAAAIGNNLQTAAAMVQQVASPWLGLCLDLFHFYVGPSKTEDLGCLTRENLFHVQVCDLADVPREFAMDGDRILPGDGDVPYQALVNRLREIGYDGYVSVELMNPKLWQVPARQFGEVAWSSVQRILGPENASADVRHNVDGSSDR